MAKICNLIGAQQLIFTRPIPFHISHRGELAHEESVSDLGFESQHDHSHSQHCNEFFVMREVMSAMQLRSNYDLARLTALGHQQSCKRRFLAK